MLTDAQLATEAGDAAARQAWQAQRQHDLQSGQSTLSAADQSMPSWDYIMRWKSWYARQRDFGQLPQAAASTYNEQPASGTTDPTLGGGTAAPSHTTEPNPPSLAPPVGGGSGGGAIFDPLPPPEVSPMPPTSANEQLGSTVPEQNNAGYSPPLDMGQTTDENGNPTSSGGYDPYIQSLTEAQRDEYGRSGQVPSMAGSATAPTGRSGDVDVASWSPHHDLDAMFDAAFNQGYQSAADEYEQAPTDMGDDEAAAEQKRRSMT